MPDQRRIAYFSMEIDLDVELPTYSGGLVILAGDSIRAAADLQVPIVAVTLVYRKGYFYQRLDATGWQREEPEEWVVQDHLVEMPQRVAVTPDAPGPGIRWPHAVSHERGTREAWGLPLRRSLDDRIRPERRRRGAYHGLDIRDVRGDPDCAGGGSAGCVVIAEIAPSSPMADSCAFD